MADFLKDIRFLPVVVGHIVGAEDEVNTTEKVMEGLGVKKGGAALGEGTEIFHVEFHVHQEQEAVPAGTLCQRMARPCFRPASGGIIGGVWLGVSYFIPFPSSSGRPHCWGGRRGQYN